MRWTAGRLVVALLLAASLAACGDGEGPDGEGPTRSPTIALPSPTRTDAPEETDQPEPSQTPTEEPEPSDRPSPSDRSPGGASERPSDESSEEPSEESSESADAPTEGDEADDEAAPTWLWWLLAAIVLGAVIAIPLLLRSRRRTAWRQQLSQAEGELGWVARELLPGLRRAASREEVAGGWAVATPRVTAAEDELTVLESTAYDDSGRDRARSLREASRLARQRMAQLVAPGPHDTWSLDLDAIMADLEAALGPPRVSPA